APRCDGLIAASHQVVNRPVVDVAKRGSERRTQGYKRQHEGPRFADTHSEPPGGPSHRRHSCSSSPKPESSWQARIRPIAGFTQPPARSRAEWLPPFRSLQRRKATLARDQIRRANNSTCALHCNPRLRTRAQKRRGGHRGRRRTGLADGYDSKERCYATWPTVYHRDAAVPWRVRVRSSACLLPAW